MKTWRLHNYFFPGTANSCMVWTNVFRVWHLKKKRKSTRASLRRLPVVCWCLGTATSQEDLVGSWVGSYPVPRHRPGIHGPHCPPRRKDFPRLEMLRDQRLKHTPGVPNTTAGISPLLSFIFSFSWNAKINDFAKSAQALSSGCSTWRLPVSSATSTWPSGWDSKPRFDLKFFILIMSYITFDSL